MRSIALDHIDEVRNEVATALVLVLYLAPVALDILVHLYKAIVLEDPPQSEETNDHYGDNPLRELHCFLSNLEVSKPAREDRPR